MAVAREALGLSALLPGWALSRVGCCVGTLILLQNAMLFYWGARLSSRCNPPKIERQSSRRVTITTTPVDPRIRELEEEVKQVEKELGEHAKKQLEAKDSKIAALQEQVRQLSPLRTSQPEGESSFFPQTAALAAAGPPAPLSALRSDSSLFDVRRETLRLFGHEVPVTVQFAVGFSSSSAHERALLDMVRLVFGLPGRPGNGPVGGTERSLVVAVAHLADPDPQWVASAAEQLRQGYASLVSSGHFHALHAPPAGLYPKLDVCPPFCSFKDSPEKVRSRCKHNVDHAWLMYYAVPLAPYFLLLEDDMHFAPDWILSVHDYLMSDYPPTFLSGENTPWRMIDFMDGGFGGKLFQTNELTRMAQFLLLFYDQKPGEMLLTGWTRAMTQGKRINYTKQQQKLPFQHGSFGAFGAAGAAVAAPTAAGAAPAAQEQLAGDNPAGRVLCNMTVVPTFGATFAYTPSGSRRRTNDCDPRVSPAAFRGSNKLCFLWVKGVGRGDHLTVVFDSAINPEALTVEFGHAAHQKDTLKNGAIEVSASKSPGDPEPCGPFALLLSVGGQRMAHWELGGQPPELPVKEVRCLRIVALAPQAEWLIVQRVQVRR